MYQSLEVIKGHRFIKMNSSGVVSFNPQVGPAIVEVLGKQQDIKQLPFGGFMEVGNVIDLANSGAKCALPRVKIVNIRNLFSDTMATQICYTVPAQHYVVGNYFESKAFVLLYEGEIRHFPLPYKTREPNVVPLFKK